MKWLITLLLELYAVGHPDVTGLILRGEEIGFKIKFEKIEDGE